MSYSSEVLADTPLVYWRLGDASGTTAVDSSGNSRSGTYAGSPTLGVAGALTGDADTAVTFAAASSQEVSLAYNSGWMPQASFTIEAWYKGAGTGQVIFGRGGGAAGTVGYIGVDSNGKLFVQSRNNLSQAQNCVGATTINNGAWHHVVGVRDGNNLHVYVDGVLDDASTSGTAAAVGTSTEALYVASRGGASAARLNGTVDECAFYGAALTLTRIAAHRTAGTSTGSTVTPPAATAAATAVAPALSVGSTLSPPAATATAAAIAPTVSSGVSAAVTAVAATATAAAPPPSVSAGATVASVAATATAVALPPTVSTATPDATVGAVAATATAAALPPTVAWSANLSAVAATATATALVPTVSAGATVAAVRATATALAKVPSVSNGSPDATVTPDAATALAAALAPTVTVIYSSGTDTSNGLNGRRRRARASVTVLYPAGATPSRAAVKYDKSVPLPPPTLVDGRPT